MASSVFLMYIHSYTTVYFLFDYLTAVALTTDAAIVATSRGFIRMFSQSGIQNGLYSIGSIVAVAGFHDLAIIIYHQGEPFEGMHPIQEWNVTE